MEALLLCDLCQLEFNKQNKIPKLLPKCGHTFCLECIRQMNNTCATCQTPQMILNYDDLNTNDKLMNIFDIVKNNDLTGQAAKPTLGPPANQMAKPQHNQMAEYAQDEFEPDMGGNDVGNAVNDPN